MTARNNKRTGYINGYQDWQITQEKWTKEQQPTEMILNCVEMWVTGDGELTLAFSITHELTLMESGSVRFSVHSRHCPGTRLTSVGKLGISGATTLRPVIKKAWLHAGVLMTSHMTCFHTLCTDDLIQITHLLHNQRQTYPDSTNSAKELEDLGIINRPVQVSEWVDS